MLVENFKFITRAIILASFMSLNAWGGEKKIAILDVQTLTNKSQVFTDIQNQIQNQAKIVGKKFDDEGEKLANFQKEISKQSKVISENDLKAKVLKLKNMESDIQTQITSQKRLLEDDYLKSVRDVNQKVKDSITDYSKSNDFDLVLDSSAVLYQKEDVRDITKEVIEKLNKEIPNYKVNFTDNSSTPNLQVNSIKEPQVTKSSSSDKTEVKKVENTLHTQSQSQKKN